MYLASYYYTNLFDKPSQLVGVLYMFLSEILTGGPLRGEHSLKTLFQTSKISTLLSHSAFYE